MKRLIILLLAICLINSYSSGQDLPTNNTPIKKSAAKRTIQKYPVTFTANDTCNLRINGEDHGEIMKSKTIQLPLGFYKLFFESLETGETIKKRFFRLTRDSLTDGKYTFAVKFRH
jgi:hypothetical protein